MKPPGIAFGISNGLPTLSVTRSTIAQDAIWKAVEAALDEGMSVEQFRREAAESWRIRLKELAKFADQDWNK